MITISKQKVSKTSIFELTARGTGVGGGLSTGGPRAIPRQRVVVVGAVAVAGVLIPQRREHAADLVAVPVEREDAELLRVREAGAVDVVQRRRRLHGALAEVRDQQRRRRRPAADLGLRGEPHEERALGGAVAVLPVVLGVAAAVVRGHGVRSAHGLHKNRGCRSRERHGLG